MFMCQNTQPNVSDVYCHFQKLVVKLICVLSDVSYIFMFYVIENACTFLTRFAITIFGVFFGVKRHQYDLRRQTLCLANMKLGKIFQTVNFCFQLIHLPKAICLVASGLYKVSNMVNNLKKSLKNVLAEHQVRQAS